MDRIGIGLVGYGMMGKVHALAYKEIPLLYPGTLPPIELAAICTTREETARLAARDAGFEAWCSNVEELVHHPDVEVVDVCVPNFAHLAIILSALGAGKHVIVDKPLARTLNEALEIKDATRETKRELGMVFNYRFVPALMRAKQLIDEGFLGRVYHFHAEYLHTGYQNPERPMSWRLRESQSGGGALVDLGSHVIDMVRYLLGEFETVLATTKTYITERRASAQSEKREAVDVDDAAWVQAQLENGAIGTIFVTRYATGAVDDMNVEIYGERGAIRFNLQDANVLQIFDPTISDEPMGGKQGWTRVATSSRYAGAVAPPPRAILGWNRTHAENIYTLLKAFADGAPPVPGIEDGVRVHEVIDAAYRSAESRNWVAVQ